MDDILNLSTFGDIIKKPKDQEEMSFYDILAPMRKVEPEEVAEPVVKKMDTEVSHPEVKDAKYSPFIVKSFEYMLCIKMMHWQTFGIAAVGRRELPTTVWYCSEGKSVNLALAPPGAHSEQRTLPGKHYQNN